MNEVQITKDREWVEALLKRLEVGSPTSPSAPAPGGNVSFRYQPGGTPFSKRPSGVQVWALIAFGAPAEAQEVDSPIRTSWQVVFACESSGWTDKVSVVESFVELLEEENAEYDWGPSEFTTDRKHLTFFTVWRP